ncbi:MAG: alcohol dehydrogenase catalytic domain-containing protein [Eubacteriales bacterium]|nr:alcohol dehydrogenase catalytic domain-containing protein [Eubacteriales bacterium]
MKAIRIIEPGEIRLCEEEIPEPRKDEVLCRVICVGICGTDHGIYNGEFSDMITFPLRPGHEWSGVVERVGSDVTFYKPGDRVVGESGVSCGVCTECTKWNKFHCENTLSVGTVNSWDGAMCEYVLYPARDLIKLPDNIGFEQAALIEPAANAIMAIHDAPVYPGDTITVMGTGSIGIAAVALARIYGAHKIISVGRSDYKLELCKKMGATHTINTRRENVREAIAEITSGAGAHVSVELSGDHNLLDDCIYSTKPGGVLALLAFYTEFHATNFNDVLFRKLTIKTAGGGWGYFDKVIRLMVSGQLDLLPIITSRVSLEDAVSEIVNLKKDNSEKIKVMICMN